MLLLRYGKACYIPITRLLQTINRKIGNAKANTSCFLKAFLEALKIGIQERKDDPDAVALVMRGSRSRSDQEVSSGIRRVRHPPDDVTARLGEPAQTVDVA